MKSNQTEIYLKSEQKVFSKGLFITFLLLVFALFTFTGCDKDETPFTSYLRMNLNGEKVEGDYYIRASEFLPPNLGKIQTIGIYATWNHKKPQEGSIEIILNDFDNTIGHKPFTDYSHVRILLVKHVGNGGLY